ncbi:MAG: hypothetical protein N3F66_04910 [Spirochaetes bacterium]|nr:hypothetical protein [Spirochaetota bacterium]
MLHHDINKIFESIAIRKECKVYNCTSYPAWPQAYNNQMIFKEEIGAEYGGPYGSCALSTVWNDVVDGRLTLLGNTTFAAQSAWGRLTLVKANISKPQDYYVYQQKCMLVPIMHAMEGVMIRVHPSEYKEWVRVHYDYVHSNSIVNFFSRLHQWYKEIDGVQACESIVICLQREDLGLLAPLVEKHKTIMHTFAKRLQEHIKECDTCDNSQICREINSMVGGT